MGKRRSPGRKPIIDAAAKVAMLAALREGRRLDAVAAGYGVTLQAFYSARRRDPLFAAAWKDAHAISAEAERRPAVEAGEEAASAGAAAEASAGAGETVRIVSNNRRLIQRRKMRHVRFDARRKGVFLAHFALSCDLAAAAAAAGVCEGTVHYHLKRDPDFADAFEAALLDGYRRLEAESVRQRLEAQDRLRAATEEAEAAGEPLPLAEAGLDFDRAMKLLARWDRGDGRLGRRRVGRSRADQRSYEDSVRRLDKALDSLAARMSPPTDPGAGGGD